MSSQFVVDVYLLGSVAYKWCMEMVHTISSVMLKWSLVEWYKDNVFYYQCQWHNAYIC